MTPNEKRVITRVINKLLEDPNMTIADGKTRDVELILENLGGCDEEYLLVYHPEHGRRFILLVYGNDDDGEEVICDYSSSLEDIINAC